MVPEATRPRATKLLGRSWPPVRAGDLVLKEHSGLLAYTAQQLTLVRHAPFGCQSVVASFFHFGCQNRGLLKHLLLYKPTRAAIIPSHLFHPPWDLPFGRICPGSTEVCGQRSPSFLRILPGAPLRHARPGNSPREVVARLCLSSSCVRHP